METRRISDLRELKAFAAEVARGIRSRQLILLRGPMGSGKTQFTRFLMEELGCDEACSPSFAIHNSYLSERGPVEHIDLYRLAGEDDLESTGFWDFFLAREGVVIVEWTERLEEFGLIQQLPRTWPRLEVDFIHETDMSPEERILSIRGF